MTSDTVTIRYLGGCNKITIIITMRYRKSAEDSHTTVVTIIYMQIKIDHDILILDDVLIIDNGILIIDNGILIIEYDIL